MKNRVFMFIVSMISLSYLYGQVKLDRVKSEKAVTKYMSETNKAYKPISFGECFDQTYPKEVEHELKTNKEVKYSIVHSYTVNSKEIKDMYFHLDKNYNVVGKLTSEQMDKINNKLLQKSSKMDSILNSIPH